jgi:hypothetical protein
MIFATMMRHIINRIQNIACGLICFCFHQFALQHISRRLLFIFLHNRRERLLQADNRILSDRAIAGAGIIGAVPLGIQCRGRASVCAASGP